MTVINVNGNTYSDDGSTSKDMNEGGFRTWLFPLIQDVMSFISASLTALAGYATSAAASAASAVNSPGTSASSTTSLTTAYSPQTFAMQAGKNFQLGQWVTLASAANPGPNQMAGPLTAYDPATGISTADIQYVRALGVTAADWIVALSPPGGATLKFNKYTGPQFYASGIFEGRVDLGAGSNIDLSTGSNFTKTSTTPLVLTVSGIPAGAEACFTLKLTNGGAFSFTPPAGTTYPNGVVPTLTTSGTDRLAFIKDDGGNWEMYVLGQALA